jgi:hypothetical protein
MGTNFDLVVVVSTASVATDDASPSTDCLGVAASLNA